MLKKNFLRFVKTRCLKKAKLVYTLQDTPEYLSYEEPVSYAEVDNAYRIKEFDIEYDPEVIEKAKEKVLEAREFVKEMIS